jgi:hypothetical protein
MRRVEAPMVGGRLGLRAIVGMSVHQRDVNAFVRARVDERLHGLRVEAGRARRLVERRDSIFRGRGRRAIALDKTTGVNGDNIEVTVTSTFVITSTVGTQNHYWAGVVGN